MENNANKIKRKGARSQASAIVKLNQLKTVGKEYIQIGVVILCKMKGFCPWPARVISIENTKITVQFFGGKKQTHITTVKNIFNFTDSLALIDGYIKGRKSPDYAKAVREAEISVGLLQTMVATS